MSVFAWSFFLLVTTNASREKSEAHLTWGVDLDYIDEVNTIEPINFSGEPSSLKQNELLSLFRKLKFFFKM